MNQKQLLLNYKTTFPDDTLKIISKKTGIQQTRVFRLFNGSEMKISEYKSFMSLLNQEPKENNKISNLAKECFQRLPTRVLSTIVGDMENALTNAKLIQGSF